MFLERNKKRTLDMRRSGQETGRGRRGCWRFSKLYLAVGAVLLAAGSLQAEEPAPPATEFLPETTLQSAAPRLIGPALRAGWAVPLSESPLQPFAGVRPIYRSRAPGLGSIEAGALFRLARQEEPGAESEEIRQRIERRYRDPRVLRMTRSLSADQGLTLFREASQLIDNRHLEPASYRDRTFRAVKNLYHAVDSPTFLAANRVSPSAGQVDEFQRTLSRFLSLGSVRSQSDAENVLRWTMSLASRQLGLSSGTVATEFVYGATESLDKYSTLVPPERSQGPSAGLEDHVVGIGVSIEKHEQGAQVVRVLPGGPAAEAGLEKGDLIVRVNGRDLAGQSLDQAVDLITGLSGTNVRIGIRRGENPTGSVVLTRRYVPVSSITDVKMVDESSRVGYMKLEQFTRSSSDEMDRALWDLHRQGMKSLVLDLRGNPGGLLTAAIDISNKFVPCGSIVSTRGRNESDNSRQQAAYERTWKVPLVLLVDGNSASASEILAAAVQENQRGLLVGRPSYGKGTVQTQFSLQSIDGGLRLTTARFYSPTGRMMAGAGVEPDVLIETQDSSTAGSGGVDRDLQAALEVAGGTRLRDLAVAHVRCRTHPQHQSLQQS